jgi:hypothetical protein
VIPADPDVSSVSVRPARLLPFFRCIDDFAFSGGFIRVRPEASATVCAGFVAPCQSPGNTLVLC